MQISARAWQHHGVTLTQSQGDSTLAAASTGLIPNRVACQFDQCSDHCCPQRDANTPSSLTNQTVVFGALSSWSENFSSLVWRELQTTIKLFAREHHQIMNMTLNCRRKQTSSSDHNTKHHCLWLRLNERSCWYTQPSLCLGDKKLSGWNEKPVPATHRSNYSDFGDWTQWLALHQLDYLLI